MCAGRCGDRRTRGHVGPKAYLAPNWFAVIDAYRVKGGRAVAGLFVKLPDPADHPVFLVDAEG